MMATVSRESLTGDLTSLTQLILLNLASGKDLSGSLVRYGCDGVLYLNG